MAELVRYTLGFEQDYLDTYLGDNPRCDICKKEIKEGDDVCQSFTGTVQKDVEQESEELGIHADHYALYHMNCVPRNSKTIVVD